MRTVAVFIGTIIILILLVNSGVIAGAFCVNSVGCLATDSTGGIRLDNAQQVTVGASSP
jgi:hypothetical protein